MSNIRKKLNVNNFKTKIIQKERKWQNVCIDFAIVYGFVPLWITLFAYGLNYFHSNYEQLSSTFWQNDFDLALFPMTLLLIGLPLTYAKNSRVEKKSEKLSEFSGKFMNIFVEVLFTFGYVSWLNLSGWLDQESNNFNFYQSYLEALLQFALFDASSYWTHRLFHSIPQLYKHHKRHHDITNPVAISFLDMDIVDYLQLHTFALGGIPVVIGSVCGYKFNYHVIFSSILFVIVQNFIIHCNIKLIGVRQSLGLISSQIIENHANHHENSVGNYGIVAPQIWDYLCNTEYSVIKRNKCIE